MSKYFHLIITCLVLLSFVACQTGNEIGQMAENNSMDIQQSSLTKNSELEILFVNVRLVQEPYHAEVINTVFAKGRLKSDFLKNPTLEPHHLLCSFLDKNKKLVKQTVIENPLKPHYEYLDEKDEFANVNLELETAEFSLRTQFVEGITFLKIEHILEDKALQVVDILEVKR